MSRNEHKKFGFRSQPNFSIVSVCSSLILNSFYLFYIHHLPMTLIIKNISSILKVLVLLSWSQSHFLSLGYIMKCSMSSFPPNDYICQVSLWQLLCIQPKYPVYSGYKLELSAEKKSFTEASRVCYDLGDFTSQFILSLEKAFMHCIICVVSSSRLRSWKWVKSRLSRCSAVQGNLLQAYTQSSFWWLIFQSSCVVKVPKFTQRICSSICFFLY